MTWTGIFNEHAVITVKKTASIFVQNSTRKRSPAYIGIRPEHIELVDTATTAVDALVGCIEKCVFLGSFTRITLNVDDKRLVLELRGRRTDLVPGAPLTVRIPADAIHRLQDAAQ